MRTDGSKPNRGRPRKYKSADEVQGLIDEYFRQCEEKDEPPLVTGVALALGMSRRQLIEYGDTEEFGNTIKRAKDRCEHELHRRMILGKVREAGAIFSLKNNYHWADKVDHVVGGKDDSPVVIEVTFVRPPQRSE